MLEAHSVNERVQQSRNRRRAAGLKRIEVYVPENKADLLKAYAAQLREGSQSEVVDNARKLIDKAYKRFHARCLDNIYVDPKSADLADAAVVAAALMNRGNSEAYKLGQQLRKLAR